jgi:hypothetical protein
VNERLQAHNLDEAGFIHGFSLRDGDADALTRALGVEALHQVSQVHGREVRRVAPGESVAQVRDTEADALVAPAGAIAIGVRVADCVPVLVADPVTGAVGAIHAGWRGTVAGVVRAAIGELAAQGGDVADFRAALFPHIGPCCFEVGDDVAAEIERASPIPNVVVREHAKPHVDLARVVIAQLAHAGLREERIEVVPGCTKHEPARFHSFRRDGANSGRHHAVIVSR